MQDFKRVKLQAKGGLNNLIFSIDFSNVKYLVLSNGSEYVLNVI